MNMNATAQMVTTTQVGCGKAKPAPTTGEQEMIALHATAAKLAGAEGIIVKPTTGDSCAVVPVSSRMCEHGTKSCIIRHSKPTTGEWTPKRVEELLGFNAVIGCERIADAHNASLASERERFRQMEQTLSRSFDKVQAQLAAEREKNEAAAQKPLMDALTKADLCLERLSVRHGMNHSDLLDINDTRAALAKAKVGK